MPSTSVAGLRLAGSGGPRRDQRRDQRRDKGIDKGRERGPEEGEKEMAHLFP